VSIIEAKIRKLDSGHIAFSCPGCDTLHVIRTQDADGPGPRWQWNKSCSKPTLQPSVLVNGNREKHLHDPCIPTCHSFVKEGNIQYLNDCTHALVGQTVELPDIEKPNP
jgi:hypothetical protein